MKKRIFLGFFLALVLGIGASDALALNCVQSQKVDGSDACWTQVRVAPEETRVVSIGSVLVYDFTSSASANESATQVRLASSVEDNPKIAGVAQDTLTAGQLAFIQVRGKGTLLVDSTASSGDRVWPSGAEGYANDVEPVTTSGDGSIAFLLADVSARGEADAFFTIV